MGPFDESELKAKWAKGELLPIDYVYDDKKQDWVLLSERFLWAQEHPNESGAPPPLNEIASRKPTTAAPTVPLAAKPNPQKEVQLVDGKGELELQNLLPGQIELALQKGELQLENSLKIQIRSAEPQTIEWTLVQEQTVGETVEMQIRALDVTGRICSQYDDSFHIRINGGDANQISVPLKNGQALVRIQHTKAEIWNLTFHYQGNRVLRLPDTRTVEWKPGPAVKLILDGPQEYTAGHPLKVAVRAVDRFGNLAKTFHGTVVLEVKAS